MARISKADHPRILHLVEVDRRKVVEVAAEYDCTPANIYVLLGKMRRGRAEEVAGSSAAEAVGCIAPAGDQPHGPVEATTAAPEVASPSDRFTEADVEVTVPPVHVDKPVAQVRRPAMAAQTAAMANSEITATASSPNASDQLHLTLTPIPTDKPASSLALVEDLLEKGTSAGRAGTASTLAKTGVGLAMRTVDGDETITSFRSLDELLAVIKPILRSAARSPDAVWFSIQPVDLAMLEVDAA